MRRKTALTLIEVVAALALLAGVATLLLTAQGRSLEQLRATGRQERAAALADALLARWRLEPGGAAVPLEGAFDEWPGWHWRRRVAPCTIAELDEVSLTIYLRDGATEQDLLSYTWFEVPLSKRP